MFLKIERNIAYKLVLTPKEAYELKMLVQNYPEQVDGGIDIRSLIYQNLPSFEELKKQIGV